MRSDAARKNFIMMAGGGCRINQGWQKVKGVREFR